MIGIRVIEKRGAPIPSPCCVAQQQEDGMGPPLFSMALIPIILKLQDKYKPLGVAFTEQMDDITVHLKDLTEEYVTASRGVL